DTQCGGGAGGGVHLLEFVGLFHAHLRLAVIGDDADGGGWWFVRELFEGHREPVQIAWFGEFDLDPLPDGPGEGTGAPRGGGVVLTSGVGSVRGVAVGRAGVDTALGRGRGDRCHPHVLGVCDEVRPGRVDHVGGGDVAFALLILCEGGGDVAAHVGVDDLAPAGGVGDDGVLGVDLLRP